MNDFPYRCKCGQPYDANIEKYFPEKDTFTNPCPACGNILSHRLRALDARWTFDMSFKKNQETVNENLTVQEVIDLLIKIEDKSLPVEVTTGHLEKGGRFYGLLKRVSTVEDYKGKRVLLSGYLQE